MAPDLEAARLEKSARVETGWHTAPALEGAKPQNLEGTRKSARVEMG